jgi:hypothetical protein
MIVSSRCIKGPASQMTSKGELATPVQAPLYILTNEPLHQSGAVRLDIPAQGVHHQTLEVLRDDLASQECLKSTPFYPRDCV